MRPWEIAAAALILVGALNAQGGKGAPTAPPPVLPNVGVRAAAAKQAGPISANIAPHS